MAIEYRIPRTNLFSVGRSDDGRFRRTDPTIDWTLVRRARPLDKLLPATERWAASFADADAPKNLIRLCPRVANRLAFAWQDPGAVQDVLDDVLIDRRGGRQGFPPLVAAELLRLRGIHLRIWALEGVRSGCLDSRNHDKSDGQAAASAFAMRARAL